MVHHEGILRLSRVFMRVGEGMFPNISIRDFTIRFNEVLGSCHISTKRDAKNVESVIDNGLVAGLIKKELKVLCRTVKLKSLAAADSEKLRMSGLAKTAANAKGTA
jgi:hypothetical protein